MRERRKPPKMKIENLSVEDLKDMSRIQKEIDEAIEQAEIKKEKTKCLFEEAQKITYPGSYGLIHLDYCDLEDPKIIIRLPNGPTYEVTYHRGINPYHIVNTSSHESIAVDELAKFVNNGRLENV